MRILIDILDLIVLVLIIVQVPRTVFDQQSTGAVSLLLSIVMVLVLVCFSIVSFLIFGGMVAGSSFEAASLLAFLLVMLYFARISWVGAGRVS